MSPDNTGLSCVMVTITVIYFPFLKFILQPLIETFSHLLFASSLNI